MYAIILGGEVISLHRKARIAHQKASGLPVLNLNKIREGKYPKTRWKVGYQVDAEDIEMARGRDGIDDA